MTPTPPPNCRLLGPEEIVLRSDKVLELCSMQWVEPDDTLVGASVAALHAVARPVASAREEPKVRSLAAKVGIRLQKDNAALKAENEAMRAALEEIDEMIPENAKLPLTVAIREVVRKALGK